MTIETLQEQREFAHIEMLQRVKACSNCPDHTDSKCCHSNATNGNDSQLTTRPADPYFEHENWGNC